LPSVIRSERKEVGRPLHEPYHQKVSFRLRSNGLKLQHGNVAGKVEMDIENIRLYAAFQSEKTGSTPVGSAMISVANFDQPCSFGNLFLVSYSET
jgi:hypothetical protein